MDYENEAANDSCTAHDSLPDPPSVIRPTLPPTVQVPVTGPAPGDPTNPLLATVPGGANSDMPAVPQQPLHQDPYASQEHAADPNDKALTFYGSWDVTGANRAPRFTGAQADIPVDPRAPASARIHGDQLQHDLPQHRARERFTPPPAQQKPTTVTIPMPNLSPPPATEVAQHLVPPLDYDAPSSPLRSSAPNVPDLHLDHLAPLPGTNQ